MLINLDPGWLVQTYKPSGGLRDLLHKSLTADRIRTQDRRSWVLIRFGGQSTSETPGPFPNPEVKRCCADGTAS